MDNLEVPSNSQTPSIEDPYSLLSLDEGRPTTSSQLSLDTTATSLTITNDSTLQASVDDSEQGRTSMIDYLGDNDISATWCYLLSLYPGTQPTKQQLEEVLHFVRT